MCATRIVDFLTGFETSSAPAVANPSDDADAVNKGYADSTYTAKSHVYGVVDDITALKAIASAERFDKQILYVDSKDAIYAFDAASSATGDDDLIVQPDTGTGRWIKKLGGGFGGGGGAAGIDQLEQKTHLEKYSLFTSPIDNSVNESFNVSKSPITGVLLENYTSGTTAHVAWEVEYLNPSDKNTDTTTNWTVQGAGATLTTSGTFKIGSSSLSFDKNGTATNARIRYDIGSATGQINGNTELLFWINLPSITNLSNIEVRVDVDSTNYQTYIATTDHLGNALTTGWQLMKFDLSSAGSTSGTGWDKSKTFRYLHIGVNTSSAAQTYTAILVDSIHFSIANPERYAQFGSMYTIYNTSTVDEFQLDVSSSVTAGTITLTNGLSNAYAGGTSSSVRRFDITVAGDDLGRMEDGLSGEIADLQYLRICKILPESLSAQNFQIFSELNTNCIFKVLTVPSSTQITVEDLVDQSANLVSGKIIHVFKTHYLDGKPYFEYRTLDLTITSSSYSASVTTINTGTNTGIEVGDYVVLKHVDTKLSLVSASANESFQTTSIDSIRMDDFSLMYPNYSYAWAHYYTGGINQTEALSNQLPNGTGKSLTINGSPNLNDDFLNGQFSSSGFTGSNFLHLSGTDSQQISGYSSDCSNAQFSFWFKDDNGGGTGAQRILFHRHNDSSVGWKFRFDTAGTNITLELNATGVNINYASNPSGWNHVVLVIDAAGGIVYRYLNATLLGSTSISIGNTGAQMRIGRNASDSLNAASLRFADLYILRNAPLLTQGQIESMYTAGKHIRLGFGPQIKYRNSINSLTGQKLSIQESYIRSTDTAVVSATGIGAIKV